jgi:hypothetical protein
MWLFEARKQSLSSLRAEDPNLRAVRHGYFYADG